MFNRRENSTQDSNSVELYFFKCGANKWRFNGGERTITYKGHDYLPAVIHNSGVTQSGDPTSDDLQVFLPTDNTLVTMLVEDRPSVEVQIIIRRKHFGDNDAPIDWIGTLTSFGRTENAREYKLTCQVESASFNRLNARMSWSRQCQHALYDRNCTVDKNDFDVTFDITKLDKDGIHGDDFDGHGAGYFNNGFIEWTNTYNIIQRRAIETNSRHELVIMGGTRGLEVGMTIKAFPGCRRNTKDCDEKFDNLPNYGGFAQLIGNSPFKGDPIF